MTNKIILLIMSITLTVGTISCQKSDNNLSGSSNAGNTERRGGKKNNEDPPPPPPEIIYDVTYQLAEVDDPDPLYRFSISQSSQLILLQSDPSITSWGTDYWGYWASPYPLVNNVVNYTIGLSNTVYQFTPVSSNTIDVTITVTTAPYTGGPTTTTVTHPGTYTIVP